MENDFRRRRGLRGFSINRLIPNVITLAALCAGLTSIRFGLGRFTTQEEVDYVVDKMVQVVTKLRELSPLYEMAKEGIDISKVKWQTA